ncbi:MAG: signal peptide peptidase SppA [Bacteroidetes bacterium]|nr:signal peptide peptidase SppA [Bacteroidota bacterium]
MSKTGKWLIIIFGIILAFTFFLFLIFISLFSDSDTENVSTGSNGTIALIELKETITGSENIVRQLKQYRESKNVAAIVLRIESPGGGVAPSQEIYQEIKKTKKIKPVVVSMGSVAASGGYYIAVGADKIVANPGTVTGSIGVISQFMHYNELMQKLGITSTTVKSGKLKDAGSPFRTATKEDILYFQEMIDDIYEQFVSSVAEERHLEKTVVKKLADGRVFTGRRAYELKLIDTLGTYEDAIAIASKLANISGMPTVIRERKKEKLSDLLFGSIAKELHQLRHEMGGFNAVQYLLQLP